MLFSSWLRNSYRSAPAAGRRRQTFLSQRSRFRLVAAHLCVDLVTIISNNYASDSDDDVFGVVCFI